MTHTGLSQPSPTADPATLTIHISQGNEYAGAAQPAHRCAPIVNVDIDAPSRFGSRNLFNDAPNQAGGANWLGQMLSQILGALFGGSRGVGESGKSDAAVNPQFGDLPLGMPGQALPTAQPGPGTNAALAASTLFKNMSGNVPELMDMAKLRDMANSTDPNKYTESEKQAARFFVQNPDMFDLIESRSDLNKKDGKMSMGDISRWMGGDDKARDPAAHGIDVTSTSNPQAGNNIGAAKAMRTLLDLGRPVDNSELSKMTHSPDYTEQQRNAAQFMKANPHIWTIFETGGNIGKADGRAGGDDSREVVMDRGDAHWLAEMFTFGKAKGDWQDSGVGR